MPAAPASRGSGDGRAGLVGGDQVQREAVAEHADAGCGLDLGPEAAHQFASGGVAIGMEDAG